METIFNVNDPSSFAIPIQPQTTLSTVLFSFFHQTKMTALIISTWIFLNLFAHHVTILLQFK